MSKRLADLFELPEEEVNLQEEIPEEFFDKGSDALSNLEKIENALPQVSGLESADNELDELADLATNSFKDLCDIGMSVEAKYSSEIFSAASSLLGHAIQAKSIKINKKLKQIDLMLKKAQLDAKNKDKPVDPTDIPPGEVSKTLTYDRNELLKQMTSKKEENSPTQDK